MAIQCKSDNPRVHGSSGNNKLLYFDGQIGITHLLLYAIPWRLLLRLLHSSSTCSPPGQWNELTEE